MPVQALLGRGFSLRGICYPPTAFYVQASKQEKKLKPAMRNSHVVIFIIFVGMCSVVNAQQIAVTDPTILAPKNAQVEVTTYHGEQALKLTEKESDQMAVLAVVKNLIFRNGTIDIDVSGAPAGARSKLRGDSSASHFACNPTGCTTKRFTSSHQRTRRRPTSPQSQHAIHLRARLDMAKIA